MKKKLLLCVSLIAILVFVLALAIGAEEISVNTITSDTYGTIYQLSADPGLENAYQYKSVLKNIVDSGTEQETLCILTDGTNYYVFPTSYIVVEFFSGREKGKFQYATAELNTALAEWDASDEAITLPQFETTSSWGNTRVDSLVRIEFSRDVLYFDRQHCLIRSTNIKEAIMHDDIYFNSNSTGIFSGCAALETVRLSTKYTTIPTSIFYGCTAFKGISNWDEIKDNITKIDKEAFYNCKALTSLDVDNGKVTSVGESAFYGCSALVTLKLPNTVESFGQSAFQSCGLLTGFDIPDSLTTMGNKCFQSCSSITRLEFPPTTTGFGRDCFNGCSNLEYINIPRDCTAIGEYTFSGCSKVFIDLSGAKSLKSTGSNNSWGVTTSLIFPEGFETCSGISSSNVTEIVFPNSTTSIGIIKCNITEFVVPEGVTSLGSKAFDYCANLKKVTLPRGLTSIVTGNNPSFFGSSTGIKEVIYTGSKDDAILTDVFGLLKSATLTIANHCDAYHGGNHQAGGEVQKAFLGQAFASDYKIYTECGRECGAENVIETIGQLIHLKGYATSEIPGNKAMMHSFVVDKSLVSKYQEHFADLKFGILAVGENTSSPFNGNLIDAQGNKAHEKIAMSEFTNRDFDEIEIKIGGIDGYEDSDLYFCGYVIGGESVYYIENDAIKTQAETVTYNDVCAILTGTGNEEENENV